MKNTLRTAFDELNQLVYELGRDSQWAMVDSRGNYRLRKGSAKHYCERFSISRTTLWRITRGLTKQAARAISGTTGWHRLLRVKQIAARLPKHLWRTAQQLCSHSEPPKIVSHTDHLPLLKSLLSGALDIYALSERKRAEYKQILSALGVSDAENWVQLQQAIDRCQSC